MMTDNRFAAIALSISLGLHIAMISAAGGYFNILRPDKAPIQIKAITLDEQKLSLLPEIKIIGDWQQIKPVDGQQVMGNRQQKTPVYNKDAAPSLIEVDKPAVIEDELLAEQQKIIAPDTADREMLRYQDTVKQRIQSQRYYPLRAQRMQIEGVVGLQFKILADGTVKDIHVLQSSGSGLLDSEAIKTIQKAAPYQPLPETIMRDWADIRVAIIFSMK